MGQARHRKQLLTAHGPRTKGTGIGYVDTPAEPEPTLEQLAAREMRQHERQVVEATKARKQRIIQKILGWADSMMATWRKEIDRNDERLRNFAGWTKDSFCQLPIEADLAAIYCTVFAARQARAERSLSLSQRDEVVEEMFHRQERHSDRIVAEVLRITRVYAEQCIDEQSGGFYPEHFLSELSKRKIRTRQRQDWVHRGLEFVVEMMTRVFQQLGNKEDL